MANSAIIMILGFVVLIVVPVGVVAGLVFLIKYLIRYNAKQKAAAQERSEYDKMRIEDL